MIRHALILSLLAATLHAAPVTLNFGAQNSGAGLGANGAELPAGCLVMFGHFTLPTATLLSRSGDHFTLLDHFESFATTRIGTFNGTPQNIPGAFTGTTTVESNTHGGKRLAIWVLDAPNFATATRHLIFSDPAWTVPSFGSLSCQTSDPDLATASGAILIATRQAGVTSPTLGGILNQAVALSHPDDSDHDRDGRAAIVEHATGTDPGTSDVLPLKIIPGTLTLTRRLAVSGTATQFQSNHFQYRIERSTNLTSWNSFDAAVQSRSSSPHPSDPSLENLFLVFPGNPEGRDFYRIIVTRR
ncbi:MAG: hypothetical protein MUF31_15055 [Akkermansiaceae bacterium]|jgi:hypothetical protein|nr:hypothetical protein [Akkermansiaceae bacterium]